jgi:hypothetical protein
MAGPAGAKSSNLMLSLALALFSYVPFPTVAKVSLIVSMLLFVVDPLPPTTRLVAVFSVIFIGVLNHYYQQHELAGEYEADESAKHANDGATSISTENGSFSHPKPGVEVSSESKKQD